MSDDEVAVATERIPIAIYLVGAEVVANLVFLANQVGSLREPVEYLRLDRTEGD
jgi:hypothetical protein